MPPRELDELGQIVDDAKDTVEELQADDSQQAEKLEQLHQSLEDAADTVDELEERRAGGQGPARKTAPRRTR